MPVVAVEYLWCSGANTHHDLRSKVKSVTVTDKELKHIMETPNHLLEKLPVWNFDGSSTGQALGRDTEILIKPIACFKHPFMTQVPSIVALCECYLPNGQPTPDNTRYIARQVFHRDDATKKMAPWFGLEQEYVLYQHGRPLGWPAHGEPAAQGAYYCSNGVVAYGRKYAEAHYSACVSMGLNISGTNAEVMPGQWEYQVGPCEGIEAGDQAIMARWAMLRVLEQDGIDVNFDSKPMKGDWNGSGMHTNFSTVAMRNENGIKKIHEALENLSRDPFREVAVYGNDNNQRLSGKHETSRLDHYDYGVGSRCTSIRIPNETQSNGRGYFEDRRPSASADPYLVTSRLFASSCAIPSEQLDSYGREHEPDFVKDLRADKQKAVLAH